MNTTQTTRKQCRKIEPLVSYDASGHRSEQECGNCGFWIEATATGWRHIWTKLDGTSTQREVTR